MRDLSFDLQSLRAALRTGDVIPSRIAAEALRRIEDYPDPAVWITRLPNEAVMARAATLEADPKNRDLPLYGVPFAVKDNIDVVGLPTTAACPAFAYEPEESAPVVALLLEAGALLLGKTNLDQFATGLVGTRSPYGAPACVFDKRFISGGSSSGSAVAVAAGLVGFALGTDTAGSGRVPAAFNNIVGLKPTRGLLSTCGVLPACRSLDCVSIFAGTAADADEVAGIAEGFDAADPFSRTGPARAFPQAKIRFGVLGAKDREFDAEMQSLYDAAITRLAGIGGIPVEFDYAPFAAAGQLLYGGAYVAERYAAIKGFIADHEAEMDLTVREIILGAQAHSAADAFEAQYRLAALRGEAGTQWAKMDVMLLPTAPAQFTFEEVRADPIGRNAQLGHYTNFVNLLDCCAIALPAGFRHDGLAFGVTLIAPGFADRGLARLAARLQHAVAFGIGADRQRPLPQAPVMRPVPSDGKVSLFVVGAHLSGMALNGELTALGAEFDGAIRTAPDYRLFVLPHTVPPKPGLVRAPGTAGPGIEGEVWRLSAEAFGQFVSRIPSPLGIGKILLADGTQVCGFLCEACATADAQEITALGGWRAYIALGR
jgi:allophanate hydrolase